MSNLKIISMNCRGLADSQKRNDVFNFLRDKGYSIYCLQDTHFTNNEYNCIRTQWGYNIHISPGTRESRGVAILLNNNFEYKIKNERIDDIGNMICLDMEIEEKFTVSLINIYGPNADSPGFYSELNEFISQSTSDFVIVCGDFNLVQDFDLDCCNYRALNNQNARKELLNLKDVHNLSDPWRIHNPHLSTFTWFKKNPIKKSRLDFFLISNELLSLVENISIKPGYRTDHSIVMLELRLSNFKKGKGFWKFNNALLQDTSFVENVKKTIASVTIKYAVPVYNFEKIQNIPVYDIQFIVNDQQFFEQLLLEIRGMIIPFSSLRKHKQNEDELNLKKRIEHLENITNHLTTHTIFHDMLEEHKIKLEAIRKEVLNGIMLRSKANWIEYGEKPTKYFCSLEKRNYINKNVKK